MSTACAIAAVGFMILTSVVLPAVYGKFSALTLCWVSMGFCAGVTVGVALCGKEPK